MDDINIFFANACCQIHECEKWSHIAYLKGWILIWICTGKNPWVFCGENRRFQDEAISTELLQISQTK